MKQQPVEPTNESLAKILKLDIDFVSAASLSEEQKQSYAMKINKGEKIKKWLELPTGIVLLSVLFGSPFIKDKEGNLPPPVTAVFAAAALGYVGSRMINRTNKISEDISRTASKNLLESYRNKMGL